MRRKKDSASASARDSKRGKQVGKRVDEAESEELGPSFAELPLAITSNILLQLPIKSILICRCVCRTWNEVISDPRFAQLHFERAPTSVLIRTNDPKRVSRTLHLLEYDPQKFDDEEDRFCSCEDDFLKPECKYHMKLELKFKLPLRDAKLVLSKIDGAKNPNRQRRYIACKPKDDKFDVVNSCNGILCLRGPRINDPFFVCNPITGEYIKLPEASEIDNRQGPISDFYFGFGFQSKTNEYKVIRLFTKEFKNPRYIDSLNMWEVYQQIVEIHTLGTPTWRNVRVDDPTFTTEKLTFPTHVNGALHWIRFEFDYDGSETSILSFNFESERFQTLPSPPGVFEHYDSRYSMVSMGELRESLYICDAKPRFNSINIWIMKKYGIGKSWTKVFKIDQSDADRWPNGLYLPVKHFKIGAGMLMYHSCNCFIYCESKGYEFKFYKVRGTKSKFEAITLIPSLISLKDVVKGDNVEVLNVHSRCGKFKLREEKEVLFLAKEDVELASLFSSSSDDEESGEEYAS